MPLFLSKGEVASVRAVQEEVTNCLCNCYLSLSTLSSQQCVLLTWGNTYTISCLKPPCNPLRELSEVLRVRCFTHSSDRIGPVVVGVSTRVTRQECGTFFRSLLTGNRILQYPQVKTQQTQLLNRCPRHLGKRTGGYQNLTSRER